MANDDAVEIPTQYPIHRPPRGGPVPQSPTEHRSRAGSPVCAHGTRQGSHRSWRALPDREAQIADDQSPAWPVQKGDLGDEAVPEDWSLVEILAPPGIGRAPEQSVEREIPALAIETWCTEELDSGICRPVLLHEEVSVKAARGNHEAHFSELCKGFTQLGAQRRR